ncbi:L,D-transpeptidase [Plantactinospora sonchi]|uniref:L,D-transpeptidase n=1 Tax=Plantactinospora sonchi TaxID=1544735 RepID=A0ABU7S0J2_9ACTN
MGFVRLNPFAPGRLRRRTAVVALAVLGGLLATALVVGGVPTPRRTAGPPPGGEPGRPTAGPTPGAGFSGDAAPLPAAPPPADLPVVDYGPAPGGFPADPDPMSTVRLGEGLRPIRRVVAYDAPGGRPRAWLAPTISGVEVTMPIVERRSGWFAVLLPSANRTIGWVPPGAWTTITLPDLVIVDRGGRRLHWYRDDRLVASWPVSVGARATPTPLGRTFILGRSSLPGRVYADTEVFALGAVPDEPESVPTGLRGAHIGLHAWYRDAELGRTNSNGCVRITKRAQQRLLAELGPGTELLVLDRFTAPARLPGPPAV